MGEIVICRALSDGNVDLGGPSVNSYMVEIIDDLKRFGSELVIVDGALSRKTFASPSITNATILATGAALSKNMNVVIQETSHTIKLLSTENEVDSGILKLARGVLQSGRIGIIRRDSTVKILQVLTALGSSKEIVEAIDENTSYVVIKGAVSDNLMQDIMTASNQYKGVTFLVEDGTKVFLTRDTLYKFKKQGGIIKTINSINIVCVTCNPKSPYGYEFDKYKFLDGLKNSLNVPVFDVIVGE